LCIALSCCGSAASTRPVTAPQGLGAQVYNLWLFAVRLFGLRPEYQ
jgi:hypothetical protein